MPEVLPKTRKLQVFVDEEVYEELEILVAQNYSTISATVRGLIENYVNGSHSTQTYL